MKLLRVLHSRFLLQRCCRSSNPCCYIFTAARTACRLEDHDELEGMECLQQFDARLAHAVQAAQRLGKWADLVASGGSSPHTLELSSSAYDPEVRPA